MQKSSEKIYLDSGNSDVIALVKGENLSILDVGCGAGSNSRHLQALGHQVDGVTISAEEGEMAQPFLRNVYIQNLEDGLPLDIQENSYDYIICSHVLEHITYPDKLMKGIKKVLKKEGFIIVALPNLMHYASRMQLLKGNFNYQKAGIFDFTHTKWYTYKTAQIFLISYDFDLEFSTVTGKIPGYSILGKLFTDRVQKIIYKGLITISKGFFGYQLLFKGRNLKS